MIKIISSTNTQNYVLIQWFNCYCFNSFLTWAFMSISDCLGSTSWPTAHSSRYPLLFLHQESTTHWHFSFCLVVISEFSDFNCYNWKESRAFLILQVHIDTSYCWYRINFWTLPTFPCTESPLLILLKSEFWCGNLPLSGLGCGCGSCSQDQIMSEKWMATAVRWFSWYATTAILWVLTTGKS
jgi:hypothetical protein